MRGVDFGKSMVKTVIENVGRLAGRVQERRPLSADLYESDEDYLIIFDAPGVSKPDVQVRYKGNTISVRIDRFRDFYEDFEMRFPGRGMRLEGSITLPDEAAVDEDAATATLTDTGTLEIRLPKDAVTVDIETDEQAVSNE